MRFALAEPLVRHCTRFSGRVRGAPAAVAVIFTVLLVAGCQPNASATPATSVTVAVVQGLDTAPLYRAGTDGDFTEAGLHITIDSVPTVSAAIAALTSGKADVAAGDYFSFFYAQATARHQDLRVVADAYDCASGIMAVLTNPRSGITKPQDLAGKTIATPPATGVPASASKPYNLETLVTQSLLATDNVDPATISWQPMATNRLVSALARGTVSAILVQQPYILQAETQLGAVSVLDSCSGATASLPLSGYFTTKSFAAGNTPALETLRSILQQEQGTVMQAMDIRHQIAHQPGMTAQSAGLVTLGTYATTLSAASLQRVADLMLDPLKLNSALDVQGMLVR